MEIIIDVLRQSSPDSVSFLQSIIYETENENATVANALMDINSGRNIKSTDGEQIKPVMWEHSCHQRKCGACAMVINGIPALACGTRLIDALRRKKNEETPHIRLEPLKKFPLIADLVVDRSILRDNLKVIGAWLREDSEAIDEKTVDTAYEASRCLQCGCCLEICPNFYREGTFSGMASMVPTARLISEMSDEEKSRLRKAYRQHIYNGCGKSLACRNICPAGIDIDMLLVRSNRIMVWKGR